MNVSSNIIRQSHSSHTRSHITLGRPCSHHWDWLSETGTGWSHTGVPGLWWPALVITGCDTGLLVPPGQCSHCVRIMQICVHTLTHTPVGYWEILMRLCQAWDSCMIYLSTVHMFHCIKDRVAWYYTPIVTVTVLSTMFYDKCNFHQTFAIIMFHQNSKVLL